MTTGNEPHKLYPRIREIERESRSIGRFQKLGARTDSFLSSGVDWVYSRRIIKNVVSAIAARAHREEVLSRFESILNYVNRPLPESDVFAGSTFDNFLAEFQSKQKANTAKPQSFGGCLTPKTPEKSSRARGPAYKDEGTPEGLIRQIVKRFPERKPFQIAQMAKKALRGNYNDITTEDVRVVIAAGRNDDED